MFLIGFFKILLHIYILPLSSSDILENYARSPFLATEAENFMEIRDREHQGAIHLYVPNLTIRLLE